MKKSIEAFGSGWQAGINQKTVQEAKDQFEIDFYQTDNNIGEFWQGYKLSKCDPKECATD